MLLTPTNFCKMIGPKTLLAEAPALTQKVMTCNQAQAPVSLTQVLERICCALNGQ